MDKNFFLNDDIPVPQLFDPSMPTWQSLSSALDLNFSSVQTLDCFFNPHFDKSTDPYTHLDSTLSSMVTSPVASNSAMSNESLPIRELIGKLGKICNNSCYSTPVNSPPKLQVPIMDQFVKQNLPNLGNSMHLNPNLPAVSADPGFVERAAKFSCFGSHSFNDRTSQFGQNNGGILPRVFSSHSLKAAVIGFPMEEKMISSVLGSVSDKSLNKLLGSASNSNEESSVSEQIPSKENLSKTPNELNSRKRKSVSKGKAKENVAIQCDTKAIEADDDEHGKRPKKEEVTKGSTNDAGDESRKLAEANIQPPEPLKDYIHVRARRGQATDSHSLAERVRREKISERMKLLQDLVPGCNKVTGKALMLDEIINYVESLQRQVEFLSMKLASVNPSMDFNLDSLLSKDIFPSNSLEPAFYGNQPQQNLRQKNISNGAISQCSVDSLDTTLCGKVGLQLPMIEGFSEGLPRFPTFCEDDLQSLVQMGFGQTKS